MRRGVFGVVLALGGLAFVSLNASPAAAQMQGGPPPVTTAKPVVKEIVELDEFVGRFDASGYVEVRARVDGYLESVHFADGAVVKEGDLLFVIDRRPYQAALNQVLASVTAQQTRLDFAKADYERYERLTRTGVAAERTLEEKRQAYLQAQADLAAVRAEVETARLNLNFTEIRAPISGRISRKLVTEGNLVRQNETLLTTIVQLDPIYFYFDIDERSFLAYQRMAAQGTSTANGSGLPIKVKLTDEKDFTHPGTLDFTDNRLDPATGTMRLRAVLPNKELFLTPGLFGLVAVPGSPKYQAVLVPDEAILTDLDRRYVYVVGEDGSVRQQPLRLGSRTDNYRIVREGLKGDETIVVNGLQRVRLGGGKVTPQMVTLPPVWQGLAALAPPGAAANAAPQQ
jgi:multidrug efflux system membrane fusion protein